MPPPLPVAAPCVGCTGPIYLKGFIGAANPTVGGIHSELFETNDFEVFHKDIKSWVGLANAYIDLGTYFCITPYIGGGVGFASVLVLGLKDVNVPNSSVFYGADNTETNFVWAVHGGLACEVNPSATIDLSYRYTDLFYFIIRITIITYLQ